MMGCITTRRQLKARLRLVATRTVLTFEKRSNSISFLKTVKGGTFRNVKLASEIKKFETRMEEKDWRTKTPKKSRKEKWLFWNSVLQRVDSLLLSSTCFMWFLIIVLGSVRACKCRFCKCSCAKANTQQKCLVINDRVKTFLRKHIKIALTEHKDLGRW